MIQVVYLLGQLIKLQPFILWLSDISNGIIICYGHVAKFSIPSGTVYSISFPITLNVKNISLQIEQAVEGNENTLCVYDSNETTFSYYLKAYNGYRQNAGVYWAALGCS